MANSAPTDILITGGTVREQEQNGILVATLAAVDGDPGETFTYSITSDPSGAFTIVGNQIRVLAGAAIDYETAATLPITVQVTDSASNTFSKVLNISVLDLNEITGTTGNDTINGTIGDDLIDAFGGVTTRSTPTRARTSSTAATAPIRSTVSRARTRCAAMMATTISRMS